MNRGLTGYSWGTVIRELTIAMNDIRGKPDVIHAIAHETLNSEKNLHNIFYRSERWHLNDLKGRDNR